MLLTVRSDIEKRGRLMSRWIVAESTGIFHRY